jgi:hypothetical protein
MGAIRHWPSRRRRLSPAQIERRRYFGPDRAENENGGYNYGLLSTLRFGTDWTLRGGVFRLDARSILNFAPLFLNTTPDGEADRVVVGEQDRRFAST